MNITFPYKLTLKVKLIIGFLLCFSMHAQNYEVGTLEVNNNNYSAYLEKTLFVDNDGFLWYSTYNGVVREMGNDNSFFFKYNNPKDTNIAYTNALYQTSKNELVSATDAGLNILNLDTQESTWVSTTYPETNTKVDFTSIKEDANGNLWLGTYRNYIYCYTKDGQLNAIKIIESDYKYEYDEKAVEIVEVLKDQSVIFKQDKKWYHLENDDITVLFNGDTSFSTKENHTTLLIPNGALFNENESGTYNYKNIKLNYKYLEKINKQLIEIPYSKAQFIPNNYSENFYRALNFISIDKKNLVGFRLDKKEGNYKLVEVEKFPFKSKINNVLYEKNGHFWLNTEYGISNIRYSRLGFKKYLNQEEISCRSINEDSYGNITVLTYSGIFEKKKDNDFFEEIKVSAKNKKDYEHIKVIGYDFYRPNDNEFWFYGDHNTLMHYSKLTDKYTYYENEGFSTVDLFVKDDSNFLLATNKGLFEFDIKTKTYNNVSLLSDTVNLNNTQIREIVQSRDKTTLWISTLGEHALVKINKQTGEVTSYNSTNKTLPIIENSIKVIYEDEANNIWLGTEHGLQKINPETNSFKNFTIQSGLLSDNIASILEDKSNIWVGTFHGLIKINKETNAIQSYFEKDGLSHNEFNIKSALKDSSGQIYFGGLNGITSFNPKVINNINQENHTLFLASYELYDDDLKENKNIVALSQPINGFTIPNQQNYLTLKFAINDILNNGKNTFQYRILELSKDWINLGNYSTIQLRGLKPGTYNLDVRGFSANGKQTNILKYKVKINQIFYKQGWFIALFIIGVYLFIFFRNKKRREYLEKSYQQKNKIQQLEAKAMRAQMNPHFIFNTLNGMQSVMILKGEREANKYFSAFSRLLRLTLDMSNNEYITLKDEIEYLKSYLALENLRLNNNLEIDFIIDENLDIENYSIPCMLFQPIIENALLHGLTPKKENLKLIINFKKEAHYLIGEVIDNGIGRKNSQKEKTEKASTHKSWATHIMKERIAISNTTMEEQITWDIIDLEDQNNNALGTKVVLKIPLLANSDFLKTE